jgi:hypothetical protein
MNTMLASSAAKSPPLDTESERRVTVYYLAWRLKPTSAWRSEEFYNWFEAHREYLTLVEQGAENYLETRRRAAG